MYSPLLQRPASVDSLSLGRLSHGDSAASGGWGAGGGGGDGGGGGGGGGSDAAHLEFRADNWRRAVRGEAPHGTGMPHRHRGAGMQRWETPAHRAALRRKQLARARSSAPIALRQQAGLASSGSAPGLGYAGAPGGGGGSGGGGGGGSGSAARPPVARTPQARDRRGSASGGYGGGVSLVRATRPRSPGVVAGAARYAPHLAMTSVRTGGGLVVSRW